MQKLYAMTELTTLLAPGSGPGSDMGAHDAARSFYVPHDRDDGDGDDETPTTAQTPVHH